MDLKKVVISYKMTQKELNIISNSMLAGEGLQEVEVRLKGKWNQCQIFTVAKFLSEDDFGISISEMSPRFVVERRAILDSRSEEIAKEKQRLREEKRRLAEEEELLLKMSDKAA